MANVMPDGGKIRSLRAERGWTQIQLAVRCDCSDRTIANVEGGKSASSATIAALAKAFEIHFSELIRSDTAMPSDLPPIDMPASPNLTLSAGEGASVEPESPPPFP